MTNIIFKTVVYIFPVHFIKAESKAAVDYCVFGTPTMYLLDANQTIVLKPISEKQVQAWLEMVEKK